MDRAKRRQTWRPTEAMTQFVEAARLNPNGARTGWAKDVGADSSRVIKWFSNPRFVRWFNREMLAPLEDKLPLVMNRLADMCLEDDPKEWVFDKFFKLAEKFNWGDIREEDRKDASHNDHHGKAININVNLTPESRRLERQAEVVDAKLLECDD